MSQVIANRFAELRLGNSDRLMPLVELDLGRVTCGPASRDSNGARDSIAVSSIWIGSVTEADKPEGLVDGSIPNLDSFKSAMLGFD